MLAHLHQPDIDRIVIDRLDESDWPHVYRHLNDCELCLRRLIDDVIRLAPVELIGSSSPAFTG